MEWFSNLQTIDQTFVVMAGVGGVLLLFHLVTMFFGVGDVDADVDFDAGFGDADIGDSDSSFKWLSIQSFGGFFLMFGLVGMALRHENGLQSGTALLGATLSGLVTAWAVSRMFAFMSKFESSGTLDMNNAVDQEGRVYLTIGENTSGKVEVAVQGRLQVFSAVSEKNEKLDTGTRVRVVRLVDGHTLSVVKESEES